VTCDCSVFCNCAVTVTVSSTGAKNQFQGDDNGDDFSYLAISAALTNRNPGGIKGKAAFDLYRRITLYRVIAVRRTLVQIGCP